MKVKKRNFADNVLRKEFKKEAKAFAGAYPLLDQDYVNAGIFKPTSTWLYAFNQAVSTFSIDYDFSASVTLEGLSTLEAGGVSPVVVAEYISEYNLVLITPNVRDILLHLDEKPKTGVELATLLESAWGAYLCGPAFFSVEEIMMFFYEEEAIICDMLDERFSDLAGAEIRSMHYKNEADWEMTSFIAMEITSMMQ